MPFTFLKHLRASGDIISAQRIIPGLPASALMKKYRFLLPIVSTLADLKKNASAVFSWDQDFGLMVVIKEIKLNIHTWDDLFILNEIFVDSVYEIALKKPVILVDIGMHIGMASLAFAKHPEVEHIYSFEPFLPTFAKANRNLLLNSKLSDKISTHAFGLSDDNGSEVWDYFDDFPSASGCFGPPAFIQPKSPRRRLTVTLRKASEVIETIKSKHEGVPLIVKMDCEGSEFKIISDLRNNRLLESVDLFLLEWHRRDPKPIVRALEASGFTVRKKSQKGDVRGLLVAFQASIELRYHEGCMNRRL